MSNNITFTHHNQPGDLVLANNKHSILGFPLASNFEFFPTILLLFSTPCKISDAIIFPTHFVYSARRRKKTDFSILAANPTGKITH